MAAVDAMIALLLFIAVLSIVNGMAGRLAGERENPFGEAVEKGRIVSFVLSETPGTPSDWNYSSLSVPGLASERNVIDEARMMNFLRANLTLVKQSLGVEEYGFYVRLLNATDAVLNVTNSTASVRAEYGTAPAGALHSAPVRTLVKFNSTAANLEVTLWK